MTLEENISLKPFNSFGIEANAHYFVRVSTIEELSGALNHPLVAGLPVLILGGGSNLLFTKDYEGLVVKIEFKGISVDHQNNETVLVSAGAGEDWDSFVSFCVGKGYAGLENLSLIPGVVGTSPVQNIGAYGVEVKDAIEYVTVYDRDSSQISVLTNVECHFGYRESIFKYKAKDKYIIISVAFRLSLNPVYHTQYGAITTELATMGVSDLTIGAIRNAVISIRKHKLPDPLIIGNAGSFFKNPTIDLNQYKHLHDLFPGIVAYKLSDGNYKLAAGWLIEQCGWKGYRKGDAGVHAHQALVLVNYGQATGAEMLELATTIQSSVKAKFNIYLEMEVNVI